jgi:sigma-B regulation protein RsbU (phosphoserine phosphatase)
VRRAPPEGKAHRLAFWLLIIYIVLSVGKFLPRTAGQVFQILASFTFFLLIVFTIPLMWRWVFKRMLWKVRNRLIVTYLLMGLAPVVLFVTLAAISLYVFAGQFAIFAATAEINKELAHVAEINRGFALHVAHAVAEHPNADPLQLPEMEATSADFLHSGLRVSIFKDGRSIAFTPDTLGWTEMQQFPAWCHGRFRSVVIDHHQLYLRAVDIVQANGYNTAVITSLPLHKELVAEIANSLGTVTVIPKLDLGDESENTPSGKADSAQPDTAGKPAAQKSHITISQKPGQPAVRIDDKDYTREEMEAASITGGKLPPSTHFFDIPVTFYAPVETIDWATGKVHETATRVSSRPSLLYQRLFLTSLKIAALVQNVLIAVAIFFGVLELIAFIMAVRLNRTITRSIHDLYGATMEIDSGNLSHRITVTRNDQLAALSQSFNNMASSLERLLQEQREKERLQNELAIAQEVQANLFPHGNIALPMLELHGVCHPARTVSGDYYDFLLFGETGLGLAIGDISGKGISAALLMATLHSAVRAYRFAGEELVYAGNRALALTSSRGAGLAEVECGELFEEPAKILALLNRHLYRSTQPEKYATLFLAHYDGVSSRLTYSNGGQLPPLLLRADNSIARLDCGGTVVGLLDGVEYEQGIVSLHRGDILVAYSDGVTEPENEFGDFGEERLMEIVRRHRHLSLDAISEQVMQSLRNWIGGQEQPDDITLVLARQR